MPEARQRDSGGPGDTLQVLHLSRYFHPVVGGTENFVAGLARSVAPLGIHSTVLCSDRHADRPGPAPEVPVLRVPTLGPDRLQLIRRITPELRSLVAASDVLHFHDLRFGLDLRLRSAAVRAKPSLFHTHGLIFHTDRTRRVKRLTWRFVARPLLSRFDVVAADSEADFSYVVGLANARVLPNPVEVDAFATVRDAAFAPTGPLLYFGRIAPNKGIDRLAAVLRAVPSRRLVVIGSGDPHYERRLVDSFAGLPVEFAGELDGPALLDRLRTCSGIVLPSRTEGFGITLVEAMATGRPVIASDIRSYREIALDTDVALVDFDDVAGVQHALTTLCTTPNTTRSTDRAASYSWHRVADRFAALYRSLAGRAPTD